jgi:type II secretory pathway component PulM
LPWAPPVSNGGLDPLLKGRAALSKELPGLRAQALELTERSEQLDALEKSRAGQRRGLSETALREHLAAASLIPTRLRLEQGAADIHFAQADAAAVLRWASRAPEVFSAQVSSLQVVWSGPAASVRLRLSP